ncbi:MAG TPA: DUF3592 domain-containing protein [Phycisphaerae bacterium]|nr:DUF3592 domain-containing protein [Phycisphaerae bacterium]
MKFCIVSGVIIMSIGAVMFTCGVYGIFNQQRIIARAQPIQVYIFRSTVRHDESSRSADSYDPEILFNYVLNGHHYESRRVTPAYVRRSKAWAERIVARFPSGDRLTGYVDPERPDFCFLLREVGDWPYSEILFGVLFVGAGIAAIRHGACRLAVPRLLRPTETGWFQLRSRRTTKGTARLFTPLGICWLAIGWGVCSAFLSVSTASSDLYYQVYGVVLLYFAVGLWLTWRGVVALAGSLHWGELAIWIDQQNPLLGHQLALRLEQEVRWGGTIHALMVSLRCVRGLDREVWSSEQMIRCGFRANTRDKVIAELQFDLPVTEVEPTIGGLPLSRVDWVVVVRARMRGLPANEADYLLHVVAPYWSGVGEFAGAPENCAHP